MKFEAPNYTQSPNALFDEVFKTLKEGELRIVLVLVRQTFGWHKEWDRISLGVLADKSGMERKSVCRSLNSLIKKNLVVKKKFGSNGTQKCYFALNMQEPENEQIGDDEEFMCEEERALISNNSYQCPKDTGKEIKKIPTSVLKTPPQCPRDTTPSVLETPTKETITKEIKQNIIAPKPEPKKPKNPSAPKDMPAGGNNNSFYKSLEKCDDLSDRQKRLLMKYPESLVNQAVRYAYHPTTQITGGPIGRIKLLQYFLKNPDHFEDKMKNLDKPQAKVSKKDTIVSRFKRGEMYNGYEFLQDDIGVGFMKPGMLQPYSVLWNSKNFEHEIIELLKKCRIKLD